MANKIWLNEESTIIRFAPSGASGTKTAIGLTSLGGRVGRRSDRHALPSFARPYIFEWRAKFVQVGTIGIGNAIHIFLSTSNGTNADGNQASTEGAFTDVNVLRNLKRVGSVAVDGTNTILIGSGTIEIYASYISLIIWNGTDNTFSSNNDDHEVVFRQISKEIQ